MSRHIRLSLTHPVLISPIPCKIYQQQKIRTWTEITDSSLIKRPFSTASHALLRVNSPLRDRQNEPLLGPPGIGDAIGSASTTLGALDTVSNYLRYAMWKNLKPESTVFNGNLYELQVKEYLEQEFPGVYKAQLVGGAGDQGIDIDAQINITDKLKHNYRLVVQCKCYTSQRIDPKLLREIKGAVQDLPNNSTPVAMIACTNGFTKQARSEFDKSSIPIILLRFSKQKLINIDKPYQFESWQWGKMLGWEGNWKAKELGIGL